jgi:hypothetical protein
MYHLFAILILVLTIPAQSQFLNQLLTTYESHYGTDLLSMDVPFKKIFNDVISYVEPKKNR